MSTAKAPEKGRGEQMSPYLIPFYGLKGILEHSDICQRHKWLCNQQRKAWDADRQREIDELYNASWKAMDNATIGLWVTVGTLFILVLLGGLIVSLIKG